MIEKMPENYKGQVGKITSYVNSAPREWTDKEIEWLLEKHKQGFSTEQIAYSMGRTQVSVSIKLKRLKKKNDSYNEKHLEDKYEFNKAFFELLKPKTILDLYCGEKSFWKNNTECQYVTTNDINKNIKADFHIDALKMICSAYSIDEKYDLIDLDPFGSAYDCFDLAIKMANKGLCITLGELGHKRWKRLDFVSRYYGIQNIEELTIDTLIVHIQKIGLRNKKRLKVIFKKEWQNIGRVWFEIEPIKILEPQNNKKKSVEQLSLLGE